MTTQLGGYEDNLDSKGSGLRDITTTSSGDKVAIDVTPLNALVLEAFDYIVETEPDTSIEVYTYKTGGSGGTTVAVVTIVYEDATKERLVSVTKV